MEIVIFDTETTGLLKPDNAPLEEQPKIIEFYGVRINEEFEIVKEFETFINPGEPISEEITRITGIKDSDVAGSDTFGAYADKINELFIGADISVAHNIAFDNGMVSNEMKRVEMEFLKARHDICTVETMQDELGFRISLAKLYKRFYGKNFAAHRAKNDVQALVACFHYMIENNMVNLDKYRESVD